MTQAEATRHRQEKMEKQLNLNTEKREQKKFIPILQPTNQDGVECHAND